MEVVSILDFNSKKISAIMNLRLLTVKPMAKPILNKKIKPINAPIEI